MAHYKPLKPNTNTIRNKVLKQHQKSFPSTCTTQNRPVICWKSRMQKIIRRGYLECNREYATWKLRKNQDFAKAQLRTDQGRKEVVNSTVPIC